MAKTKIWTVEDREFAIDWVENKGRTGSILREQEISIDDFLSTLNALSDIQSFVERLRNEIRDESWKRLLDAIRQRKCNASKKQSTEQPGDKKEKAKANSNSNSTCASCARIQRELDALQSRHDNLLKNLIEVEMARKNAKMPEEIWHLIQHLVAPDKHGGSPASTKAAQWVNAHYDAFRIAYTEPEPKTEPKTETSLACS